MIDLTSRGESIMKANNLAEKTARDEAYNKASEHIRKTCHFTQGDCTNVDLGPHVEGQVALALTDLPYYGNTRPDRHVLEQLRKKLDQYVKPGGMAVIFCNWKDCHLVSEVFTDIVTPFSGKDDDYQHCMWDVHNELLYTIRLKTYNPRRHHLTPLTEVAVVMQRHQYPREKPKKNNKGKKNIYFKNNKSQTNCFDLTYFKNSKTVPYGRGFQDQLGSFTPPPGVGFTTNVVFVKPPDKSARLGKSQDPGGRPWRQMSEKSLQLMQRLIIQFTRPGDIVFDPFCGTASAGLAAIMLDRIFFGIDIEPTGKLLADAQVRIVHTVQGLLLRGGTLGSLRNFVTDISASPPANVLWEQTKLVLDRIRLAQNYVTPEKIQPPLPSAQRTREQILEGWGLCLKKSTVPAAPGAKSTGRGLFLRQDSTEQFTRGTILGAYWGELVNIVGLLMAKQEEPENGFAIDSKMYESVKKDYEKFGRVDEDEPERSSDDEGKAKGKKKNPWAGHIANCWHPRYYIIAPAEACPFRYINMAAYDGAGRVQGPKPNVDFEAVAQETLTETDPYDWIRIVATETINPGDEIVCRSYGPDIEYEPLPSGEESDDSRRSHKTKRSRTRTPRTPRAAPRAKTKSQKKNKSSRKRTRDSRSSESDAAGASKKASKKEARDSADRHPPRPPRGTIKRTSRSSRRHASGAEDSVEGSGSGSESDSGSGSSRGSDSGSHSGT